MPIIALLQAHQNYTMKRNNRVPIMLSDSELAKLDRLAIAEGVSRSEYIRKLIDRQEE